MRSSEDRLYNWHRRGGLAERLKAPDLKSGKGASLSWVRIPRPPCHDLVVPTRRLLCLVRSVPRCPATDEAHRLRIGPLAGPRVANADFEKTL